MITKMLGLERSRGEDADVRTADWRAEPFQSLETGKNWEVGTESSGEGRSRDPRGRRRFCGARKEMEGDTTKEAREEKFL